MAVEHSEIEYIQHLIMREGLDRFFKSVSTICKDRAHFYRTMFDRGESNMHQTAVNHQIRYWVEAQGICLKLKDHFEPRKIDDNQETRSTSVPQEGHGEVLQS